MKVLLQHVRSQLYLRSLGYWTVNPELARDFQQRWEALRFASEHVITGVQLVVDNVAAEELESGLLLSANGDAVGADD